MAADADLVAVGLDGVSTQANHWRVSPQRATNAPVWSGIVSPSFPMAKRTIVPTIEKLLKGKQTVRDDLTYKHNKSDHVFEIQIECRPVASLLYMSGENPDALKGPNLGTAAIDEPFIQDVAVFEQMVARVRDPDARVQAMGLTGTPEQLNWGYDLVEGDLADRYDVGHVTADTRSNVTVGKEYAQRLIDGYDDLAAEAYVEGRFRNLSKGQVFYSFSRANNVKELKSESAVHFVGMDFNVNPMSFCVGWRQGDHAHIYAEHELPNSDTPYACSVIKERYPQVKMVYPDPTGNARATQAPGGMSDHKWIRGAGYVVMTPSSPWGLRDSYNSVNNMFKKRRLTIDPVVQEADQVPRAAHARAEAQAGSDDAPS